MTTAATPSIKQITLGDLEHELASTRRVLERVPDGHAEWRPHEKSMPLMGLATHLATIPWWGIGMLTADHYDLATAGRNAPDPTPAAALARWDENVARLMEAFHGASDELLLSPWELRMGGKVLRSSPRASFLRGWVVSHMVHHRAQLGVYLRLLGVPVPQVYGPTADEP